MRFFGTIVALLAVTPPAVLAYNVPFKNANGSVEVSRRKLFQSTIASTAFLVGTPRIAFASEEAVEETEGDVAVVQVAATAQGEEEEVATDAVAEKAVEEEKAAEVVVAPVIDDNAPTSLYFGVGCFWHIQHEFIEAERSMLGRQDNELTSLAGYAGGTKTDNEGRVCYHNLQRIADYGSLGHGEVVGMTIPHSSIPDFAKFYFSLFDPKSRDRVDPMDRGAEYRSLIGLPGGTNHPKYSAVEQVAKDAGFELVPGKGNDPDTLRKQIVYVYDTAAFPFYQAEVYHQYHDDFQSPPYGREYNKLVNPALEDGRIKGTGCPDRI